MCYGIVSCFLFDVRCVLFVVRRLSCVVCYFVFAVRCLFFCFCCLLIGVGIFCDRMLIVGYDSLFVVRVACSLFVVRRVSFACCLFVVCSFAFWLLFVVCGLLFFCCQSVVVCLSLSVVRWLMCVVRCLLFVVIFLFVVDCCL